MNFVSAFSYTNIHRDLAPWVGLEYCVTMIIEQTVGIFSTDFLIWKMYFYTVL